MTNIYKSVEVLANLLQQQKLMLVSAESCTGGMLSQNLTALNRSSHWFACGFITYSNESKIKILGVDAKVITEFGAVSKEVAEQMTMGAREKIGADISVSITGIAGPTGGTTEKPVGTVYISSVFGEQSPIVEHHLFHGDRNSIREQTTQAALDLLIQQLGFKK